MIMIVTVWMGRFGSFEIFKATDPLTGYQGPSTGNIGILHKLLDYTINNFFPQVSELFFNVLEQMRRVCICDAFARNPSKTEYSMWHWAKTAEQNKYITSDLQALFFHVLLSSAYMHSERPTGRRWCLRNKVLQSHSLRYFFFIFYTMFVTSNQVIENISVVQEIFKLYHAFLN